MEIFLNVHEIRSVFGNRYIQQYLFVGERIVLLDAGVFATPEAAIFPYLEKIGIAPEKLSMVVAMHADADHHGGLPAIKDASRFTLLACHQGDKKLIEDPERLYQDRYNFLAHDHAVDAYLATIQFLENQPIDHIFSGHWPACHGTESRRFLSSSREFVETADELIKSYLSNRARGATLKEILYSLSPKLGSWPSDAADFLQFALYGHMVRLEQLGIVRSSKLPVEYALV